VVLCLLCMEYQLKIVQSITIPPDMHMGWCIRHLFNEIPIWRLWLLISLYWSGLLLVPLFWSCIYCCWYQPMEIQHGTVEPAFSGHMGPVFLDIVHSCFKLVDLYRVNATWTSTGDHNIEWWRTTIYRVVAALNSDYSYTPIQALQV